MTQSVLKSSEQPRAHASRTVYALIVLLTFIAYLPALHAGFIWDDAGHVTRPDLLSLHGLWRIWTELGATQQYYPVVHTAFWLEHHLWGGAPFGYHLIDILEHAFAACLLVAILRKLGVLGAGLAGFLFALTPIAVESVAWVSEQKNTLSAVFYLSAALLYLTYDESRSLRRYGQASLLFLLAVFTKSVTVTLPAALLLVLWWRRGTLTRRDLQPLLPWLIAAILAGLLLSHVEHAYIGAQGPEIHLNLTQRLLLLGTAPWFYLAKFLWPDPLIFIYPKWSLNPAHVSSWLAPLATLALLAAATYYACRPPAATSPATRIPPANPNPPANRNLPANRNPPANPNPAAARMRRGRDALVAFLPAAAERRHSRAPLTALLYFGGTLLPALGLTDIYPFRYSYVADHFQYLALLGLIVPAAWALAITPTGASSTAGDLRHIPKLAAVTLILLTFLTLTFRQSTTYRDEQTLWQTTLARNPSAWLAETNLGSLLVAQGHLPEALEHFHRAVDLDGAIPESRNSYGDALNQAGRPSDAVPQLQRAIALAPKSPEAHNNLGVSDMMLNNPSAGLPEFQTALTLNPQYAVAERNLGLALATTGHTPEAIAHFSRAAALDPKDAQAQLDWGVGLAVQGRMPDAARHFESAISLNPNSAEAHAKYALVLRSLNRLPEAEEEASKAQALQGVRP